MNVKDIIDPNARHLFLTKSSLNYAFPIVHVQGQWLYFSSPKPISSAFDSGYFLAREQQGIVQLNNPVIESVKKKMELLLHRLDLNDTSHTLVNRRQSMRYAFKGFVPISFSVFGEAMAAQLVNVSEGGLRMSIDTPLKKNMLCHLKIRIPAPKKNIHFSTDGMVIYADREEGSNKFTAGISFITPEFSGDKEKQSYLTAKTALKGFIDEKERTVPGSMSF